METNLIYKNPYLNCAQIVIAAMLTREGAINELLWKQAGLLFRDDSPQQMILTPKYLDYVTEFYEQNGIYLCKGEYKRDQQEQMVSDLLQAVVEKKVTVGISCDVYELEFCMYYQKSHSHHMLEVVGYQDGVFEVCDHYYHFQGKITAEALYRSMDSVFDHDLHDTCRVMYIEREKSTGLQGTQEANWRTVLQEYCEIMEGKPLHGFELYAEGSLIGLEAIHLLKARIVKMVEDGSEKSLDDFKYYFDGLKDISNSRYHISQLLNYYNQEEEAAHFLEGYQCWAVIANMIARMHIKKDAKGMADRIAYRFDRAYEQEAKMLQHLRQDLLAPK